jgi:hypothetical protein
MRNSLLISAAFAIVVTGPANAKRPVSSGTPASMQQLLNCRSIQDSTQRLACYDREAAAVNQAIAKRDLVLIDKQRATQTKRALFGFSIPDFGGLFGDNDDEVKEISSTVVSASRNGYLGWTIKLADGSTWAQTDDAELGLPPEKGDKVVVHRGTLGAFFLRIGSQPGFKVKRIG